MSDNPPIVTFDHALEEEFEGCRDVRVAACRLYQFLPDHRICFCVTGLPDDAVDCVKQCRMSLEDVEMSDYSTRRKW
jgi:hypothetical protein